MKKIKLNKKLFLNKDVVSNLSGKDLIGVQGGITFDDLCRNIISEVTYCATDFYICITPRIHYTQNYWDSGCFMGPPSPTESKECRPYKPSADGYCTAACHG